MVQANLEFLTYIYAYVCARTHTQVLGSRERTHPIQLKSEWKPFQSRLGGFTSEVKTLNDHRKMLVLTNQE